MVVQRALSLLLAALTLACQKPERAVPEQTPRTAAPATSDGSATRSEGEETKPEGEETTPEVVVKAEAETPGEEAAVGARPLYYERPLTDDDLKDRTLRELDLMRNTIYARIGQKFRKNWLDSYFRAQPWYQPKDEVDAKTLSEVDLRNAEKIVDYGNSIGAAVLREHRDAINERIRGDKATPEDAVEFQLIAARLGEWEGGETITERRSPLEDPDRLEELLTLDDLSDYSLRDLRILRNTVYARRGRSFNSELLQITFDDKAWYEPRDDYDGKLLTSVDRKNIRMIKSLEEELGGPISDWGHMMDEGWLYGA